MLLGDGSIGHLEFRPPDDLRLYEIPAAGVLRIDSNVLVADVVVGDLIARHSGFAKRWLAVNVTTDRAGRLVEMVSRDGFPCAIKCHVATPMLRQGNVCWQVDLWLDLLVRANGRDYLIEDEDEFALARDHGLLSDREVAGALAGLDDVLHLVQTGALLDLLASFCPFGFGAAPVARPFRRLLHADYPEVQPGVRPSW